MNQFIQRVANYIGNEIIIKGLANSKTFQKFAVKTDASIREVQKTGTEKLNQTFEEMIKQTTTASTTTATSTNNGFGHPPQKPLRGFRGFVSAFVKEIQKDMGIGK